jgi:N-acetylglucosamine malate deacetylase 2
MRHALGSASLVDTLWCLADGAESTRLAPRLLVVAAHPDDETLGAGAAIIACDHVHVVHTTNGSPCDLADARAAGHDTRAAYAQARRQEAEAALALAGVASERTHALGFGDQELSFGLVDAARKLQALVEQLRPDLVLTHAYEGGHPDHDATAFAIHAALARLASPPALLEFGLYHLRDGVLRTLEPPFLHGFETTTLPLDAATSARKSAMCDAYVSQRAVIAGFPRDVERLRRAPAWNFAASPLPETLYYERHAWGVTGPEWRTLATQAWRTLGLAPRSR